MLFKKHKNISAETLIDLKSYIDLHYPEESLREMPLPSCEDAAPQEYCASMPQPKPKSFSHRSVKHRSEKQRSIPQSCASASLSDALAQMDESFSETLMRKIDERHMTDAQCYKRAQIDRKLFSKIRSQADYRPSKATAISFALALELNLSETKDLLMKAGYALSHSSKADVIVEYFIIHGIFDKFLVNEALYEFDQPLL